MHLQSSQLFPIIKKKEIEMNVFICKKCKECT